MYLLYKKPIKHKKAQNENGRSIFCYQSKFKNSLNNAKGKIKQKKGSLFFKLKFETLLFEFILMIKISTNFMKLFWGKFQSNKWATTVDKLGNVAAVLCKGGK